MKQYEGKNLSVHEQAFLAQKEAEENEQHQLEFDKTDENSQKEEKDDK